MSLSTNQKGVDGENIACNFLSKNGFEILNKNFRTIYGEVDIIAKKENKIHFIEVKTRIYNSKSKPYEAINSKKINKIKLLSNYYSKLNNLNKFKFSIDVFSIIVDNNNKLINLKVIENITN